MKLRALVRDPESIEPKYLRARRPGTHEAVAPTGRTGSRTGVSPFDSLMHRRERARRSQPPRPGLRAHGPASAGSAWPGWARGEHTPARDGRPHRGPAPQRRRRRGASAIVGAAVPAPWHGHPSASAGTGRSAIQDGTMIVAGFKMDVPVALK